MCYICIFAKLEAIKKGKSTAVCAKCKKEIDVKEADSNLITDKNKQDNRIISLH